MTYSILSTSAQGAKTGWILSTPTCIGDAELSTGHHFRYQLQEG